VTHSSAPPERGAQIARPDAIELPQSGSGLPASILDLALQSSHILAWELNLETGEVIGNDQLSQMLGYDPEELRAMERPWATLCHPDDHERRELALQRHLRQETSRYECEYRLRKKCGDWIWALVTGEVVERDSMDTPVRMVGTTLDITARKRV